MTSKKTIALFGAGTGLGASLAERFGAEGYRVALVARRMAPLAERVAQLTSAGVEAAAFPADLADLGGIPALVRSIEERFGTIDVAVYAPVPSDIGFVPAMELDAATLHSMANLFLFSPVDVSRAVLPGMVLRGTGAVIVVSGLTAAVPMPGMSGAGPLMAAVRNYLLALNAETAAKGVYAGTVSIGAMMERSAGMRAMTANGRSLDPTFPVIDPDTVAEKIWELVSKRDQAEMILPPLTQL